MGTQLVCSTEHTVAKITSVWLLRFVVNVSFPARSPCEMLTAQASERFVTKGDAVLLKFGVVRELSAAMSAHMLVDRNVGFMLNWI